MNTLANVFARDLTCGLAATLITTLLGMSFLLSTDVPPGVHTPSAHMVGLDSQHALFGQPEPAVLVD